MFYILSLFIFLISFVPYDGVAGCYTFNNTHLCTLDITGTDPQSIPVKPGVHGVLTQTRKDTTKTDASGGSTAPTVVIDSTGTNMTDEDKVNVKAALDSVDKATEEMGTGEEDMAMPSESKVSMPVDTTPRSVESDNVSLGGETVQANSGEGSVCGPDSTFTLCQSCSDCGAQ